MNSAPNSNHNSANNCSPAKNPDSASICKNSNNSKNMKIHPAAIIAEGAKIHPSAEIGPFCIIGDEVEIGADSKLFSNVVLQGKTIIGDNNEISPFVSLGQKPQDLKFKGETTRLVIGDDNSIRESVTMSLGTQGGGGETRIGNGNLFMALSHVGHDCQIGDACVFANGATLGGHVEIGDNVIIGGLSAVHQFTKIGKHSIIGGVSPVVRDVLPYLMVTGNRAKIDGLNLVGLRRRGFSRDSIKALQQAYKLVFESEDGDILSRINQAVQQFPDIHEIAEWANFAKNSERGLMQTAGVK